MNTNANTLSAFFYDNAIKPCKKSAVISKRFVENGKPLMWELLPVATADDERLRKEATKRVEVAGKKNIFTSVTDYDLYLGKLAAKTVTFPNLNDSTLQDSYGVFGGDTLLKAMLTPGEYVGLISKVEAVNGFDVTFDDKVEDAKN